LGAGDRGGAGLADVKARTAFSARPRASGYPGAKLAGL